MRTAFSGAAGGVGLLNVVDAVMTGQADNGFALIRPPGHHATPENGMGFCLLSNVAIAARWAQIHHGAARVLIVDFDVHHGNGTQDVFYNDESVLFVSTHQFPYYPGTGAADETGRNHAIGATINIPFPPHVGDKGYVDAFRQIVAGCCFQPDLILLSAGFDAHWMDPLASEYVSIFGYAMLVRELMGLADELCHGRLVLCRRHTIWMLAHSVLTTLVRVLLDAPEGPSDRLACPGSRPRARRLRAARTHPPAAPSQPALLLVAVLEPWPTNLHAAPPGDVAPGVGPGHGPCPASDHPWSCAAQLPRWCWRACPAIWPPISACWMRGGSW
ncbi:MAG: histone deacetylase [Caldilineaceae bacterium]